MPAPAVASEAPGNIVSNIGRAIAVPSPFKKVRRGIRQFSFIAVYRILSLTRVALEKFKHKGRF